MEKPLPPPKTLSHYTSISGLMGIVTSRRLWASNASFLNDRSELLHALNAARTAIEKLSSTNWAPTLDKVVRELEEGKVPDTYVACFCGGADNLSQWRGYSGPEQGVSITFDRPRLDDRLRSDAAKLYRVTYAKITTPTKVRDALRGEFADLADLDDIGEVAEARRYDEVFKRVSSLLPKFKHLGFRDEREWRYVIQRPSETCELKFRAGLNRVVPYIEIGASPSPLPITSVTVGPGSDQALTAQSLRTFLQCHGHQDVAVNLSDIPFRN
jgi:hypothetical protein